MVAENRDCAMNDPSYLAFLNGNWLSINSSWMSAHRAALHITQHIFSLACCLSLVPEISTLNSPHVSVQCGPVGGHIHGGAVEQNLFLWIRLQRIHMRERQCSIFSKSLYTLVKDSKQPDNLEHWFVTDLSVCNTDRRTLLPPRVVMTTPICNTSSVKIHKYCSQTKMR